MARYGDRDFNDRDRDRHRGELAISSFTGRSLVVGAAMLARRHPVVSSAWVLGLMLCFFFTGFTPSSEAMQSYHAKMDTVQRPAIYDLSRKVREANHNYQNAKGWFWSCDQNCQTHKTLYDELNLQLLDLTSRENEKIRDANKEVGIFSSLGVADARERFFESFNWGKKVATNQSKWNLFFATFRAIGRDENFLNYLLSMVLQVLMNFTFGVLMAGFLFLGSLFTLVSQYKADILSAVVFYGLAALACIAFIATWILLMWLCVGTTVAVGVSQLSKAVEASNRARLREHGGNEPFGRQGRNIQNRGYDGF
jgi:hypothetical protein